MSLILNDQWKLLNSSLSLESDYNSGLKQAPASTRWPSLVWSMLRKVLTSAAPGSMDILDMDILTKQINQTALKQKACR